MSEILQEQYDAHNAKEDVSLLYNLIITIAAAEDITSNGFTFVLQNTFFNISNSLKLKGKT